jgi:hypothetical protein
MAVTAVLMTPEEYPSELGENYAAAFVAVDLEPAAHGYELALSQGRAC